MFVHMCLCVLCSCVVWMCGVCTCVSVCAWVSVCACAGRWQESSLVTAILLQKLRKALPQTLAGLSQLILTHRLYTNCWWKVGKQQKPGQSFREINPRRGGMLGLGKLGLCFLPSREKPGAGSLQPQPVRPGSGELAQFVKQQGSVVTPALCGQGPAECPQAGHCLDREDLPFCQHCSICLPPPPREFVTGSPRRSRGSRHSQDWSRRQLLGRTPVRFRSLAWPMSPSRVWFKEYF